MTLLNAWFRGGGDGGERRAFIQCDRCLPPQLDRGTEPELRARGWRFERLEEGRHLCPGCSRRGFNRRPRRAWPPEKRPGLPNLIVIGAAKCGTTSMHRYLSQHPEIKMSRIKELNFFQDPGCLDKLDTYATFFDGDAPVVGEASARYSYDPLLTGTPARIRAALPDVKLIYIVRDPVERAVSSHVEQSSRREPGPLESVLDGDPYNITAAISRYATQLERYLEEFSMDRILVVDQAELLSRRAETLRTVFRFLGVDAGFTSPEFDALANTRETKRRQSNLHAALVRHPVTTAMRQRLPAGVRRSMFAPVKRLASRELESPELTDELRTRMREMFRVEVERLRELTGERFESWQV